MDIYIRSMTLSTLKVVKTSQTTSCNVLKTGKMNKTLYHGSNVIPHPIVSLGRTNLDFGQGFYLTDIQEQADRWANRVAALRKSKAITNVYSFNFQKVKDRYKYLKFEEYDESWLDFIVANRQGKNKAAYYDIIEGGVANDRVIDSIEAYMAGMMPKEICLQNLSMHQPNNQICILNQEIIDQYLKFIKSY